MCLGMEVSTQTERVGENDVTFLTPDVRAVVVLFGSEVERQRHLQDLLLPLF